MKPVQMLVGALMLTMALIPFRALTDFFWPGLPWYFDALISTTVFIAAIALVFVWPLIALALCGIGIYAAIEYRDWYMLAGGLITFIYPQLALLGWYFLIRGCSRDGDNLPPAEKFSEPRKLQDFNKAAMHHVTKGGKMGKSTAILIASGSLGAIAGLLLGVDPAYGAGCCAAWTMLGITAWVFLARPGYRWATETMEFSPFVAAFVGPLVYLAGAFVLLTAGLMLLAAVL